MIINGRPDLGFQLVSFIDVRQGKNEKAKTCSNAFGNNSPQRARRGHLTIFVR